MDPFDMFFIVFLIILILSIVIRNFISKKILDKTTEAFTIFPEYPANPTRKPKIKRTSKYMRITMLYRGDVDENYLETLLNAGFVKASPVRYDKDNTYVIVEKIDNLTKIAFHIKTGKMNINNLKNNDDLKSNDNPIRF